MQRYPHCFHYICGLLLVLVLAFATSYAQQVEGDVQHPPVPDAQKGANGAIPSVAITFPVPTQKVFAVGTEKVATISLFATTGISCKIELSASSTANPAVTPTFAPDNMTLTGNGPTAVTGTTTVAFPNTTGEVSITATITEIDGQATPAPQPQCTVTVTVCKITSVTVTNALADQCTENDGLANKVCYVATTDPAIKVTVTAVLQPAVAAADVVSDVITWNNGTAGANNTIRLLPRTLANPANEAETTTLIATCGSSSQTMHLHIVKSSVPTNMNVNVKPILHEPYPYPIEAGVLGLTDYYNKYQATGSKLVSAYLKNDGGVYKWHFKLIERDFDYYLKTIIPAGETSVIAEDDDNSAFDITNIGFSYCTNYANIYSSYNFVRGVDFDDGILQIKIGYGDLHPTFKANELVAQPVISTGDIDKYVKAVKRCRQKYVVDTYTKSHEYKHIEQLVANYKSKMAQFNIDVISDYSETYDCELMQTAAVAKAGIWNYYAGEGNTVANMLDIYHTESRDEFMAKISQYEREAYYIEYNLYNKLIIRIQ